MKLTFLGTSATFPTKERNHSAVALDIGTEIFLFDCGEGTQRQIHIAGISPSKITKIFITHWHGDHVLGIAGLLQSFAMQNRSAPLEIFGPEKTKERMHFLLKSYEIKLPFQLKINEIRTGKILETEDFEILAKKVSHPIACLAYSFCEKTKLKINVEHVKKFGLEKNPILKELKEGKDILWKGKKIKWKDATFEKKGKKITYVVDAEYSEELAKFAEDSDILVCESTFSSEMEDAAKEKGHMTSKEAGKLAKKSGAKQLILTHFSQRYKDVSPLLAEAKKEFGNTIAAKDFMEIKI